MISANEASLPNQSSKLYLIVEANVVAPNSAVNPDADTRVVSLYGRELQLFWGTVFQVGEKVMLSDMEIPTSCHVRNKQKYAELPVVMISGKARRA